MQNVLTFYLNQKNGYAKWQERISVGAYCIRPIKASPKGIYDQKCRYIWGVFNTPLPWRTKRSIPKINFGIMRNSITFFLIWKMFMQNRLYLYWNRERVMRNVLTFYSNRKRVMQNSRKGFWENVLERCFWGTYFEGVFSFVTKWKHSEFVVKIRSAKQKRSFWRGLFILAVTHGRA